VPGPRHNAAVLSQAMSSVLPAAVGVALSPIPIVAVILMLGTPRARVTGSMFAIGWVAGLVIVSVVVLVVFGGADDPNSTSADTTNWLQVGLGLLFFSMALRQWRKRPKHGEQAEMPKWMQTVDHFTGVRALFLGVGLSAINPKNLALTLAASAAIAQAGLSTGDDVVAVAIFLVISSVTVVGAVLLYLIGGERAERPLASMREFMAQHNAVIMMVILVVLGAKLIGNGWAGLG
jgi:threonine/homoserine/homoserine lactone efflux protein